MSKYTFPTIVIFLIFLTGCGSSDTSSSLPPIHSSELADQEIKQINDEYTQGDFIFRLGSEKEQYENGEEVKLYGEIEYIGDEDEITISHAETPFIFSIEEKVRGYGIGYMVAEIGMSRSLAREKPYREAYSKSAVFTPHDTSEDHAAFIEVFLNEDGFPPGYYVVNGATSFSTGGERYEIEGVVDFKVE